MLLGNTKKHSEKLSWLERTTGLSVQSQDRYAHRTAINQRSEQTITRDAKTLGKILFSLRIL